MTEKKNPKHLGRGLQSLLGPITSPPDQPDQPIPITVVNSNFPPDNELRESLREIQIDSISPNPSQPRTTWDTQELAELAESIKTNGIIQPVIVRRSGSKFQLIAGDRRLRAAQLASLTTIPAIVRPATDKQLLELALIENIHRTDLNPIERARAYRSYLSTLSLSQSEAAHRLGQDRSVIANHIRLLDLPDQLKQMLINRQLTMGHARAILALPTDELRRKLANRAMAGRLSVREVERLVSRHLAANSETSTKAPSKPAHIHDLETRLTSELGARVSIETRRNGRRGRIVIEFYSLDDFDRITEKLGLTATQQT